jgi:sugar lactone lactonase YvrE
MNDGGCDPQGRFYCGTMAYAETPGAGTLYRLDPDGTVHVTLREVTISNGLQWNRAGNTVFYADTPTGRVDSFDFDAESGVFTNRRTFTEISGGGFPDGMAIDRTTASGSPYGVAAPSTATTGLAGSTSSSTYPCPT